MSLKLHRVPITDMVVALPPIQEEPDRELATRADRMLGYTPHSRNVRDAHGVTDNYKTLEKILVKHDIRPFTAKSVTKYMAKERARSRTRHAKIATWVIRTCSVLGFICLASFVIGLLGSFIALACGYSAVNLGWMAGIGVCGFVVLTIVACGLLKDRDEGTPEWHRASLSGYRKPIPEFALQTACDIAEGLRASATSKLIHMSIFELEMPKRRAQQRDYDPFLGITIEYPGDSARNITFYVEQWFEPRFKGTRQEVSDAFDDVQKG